MRYGLAAAAAVVAGGIALVVIPHHGAGSSLPTGVTLQALDGSVTTPIQGGVSNGAPAGTYSALGFFGAWGHGPGTSSSYYPIAVFNQNLGWTGANDNSWATNLSAYQTEGINTLVNACQGHGSTCRDVTNAGGQGYLSALNTAGMVVIDAPLAPSGGVTNTYDSYVWTDEPDGNNRCGDVPSATVLGETVSCSPDGSGRTPATVISQVNADLAGLHGAGDATRPAYCQYTKPVAEDSGLTGGTGGTAAAYEEAGCNIVSYDSYIQQDGFASNHDVWRQYDDVVRVRQQAGENPATNTPANVVVWPFIEAGEPFTTDNDGVNCGGNQWSRQTITPAMEVAEAWQAVIGGARGIQWFDHSFGCQHTTSTTFTNGQNTATVSSATGLGNGVMVSGVTGLPAFTTVTSLSGTTVTLSNTFTGTTGAQNATFSPSGYFLSGDSLIGGEAGSPYGSLMQTYVKNTDSQISALASILNDRFANSYVTAVTNPHPDSEDSVSANYMVKYDQGSNSFYVFAGPTFNGSESVTFTIAGNFAGTVTNHCRVVDGGTNGAGSCAADVTVASHQFTLSFADQTDIRYVQIPNQ